MKLFYRIFGTGKPLVILHGLFGSSDNWQTFAKSISDHFQVITIDLRNHGNSPHAHDINFNLIDEDLIETLDEIGLHQYYLLGHSMGGKAAAYHALHHPDRVEKLVVIDIAPRAYAPHHTTYFSVMRGMDFDQITNRIQADVLMQQEIPEVTIRQFLLKNLVRDDSGRFKWKFNLEAIYQHYDEINGELRSDLPFTHPVLFIKGEYSDYITTNDERMIHDLFPLAVLETIPEAGHWVHADQPGKLKERILLFLS
ncbi:MAG: alpha/beta fold hydrolase, partial [Saprospiraceae bacterium]